MNLRKTKTMTREEIIEELGNITKGQEKKLDDQTAMIKQQAEQIDSLKNAQMSSTKQQAEQIDSLAKAQMAQLESTKKQINVLTDTIMKVLSSQKKK